jgi:hypothetical protein
VNNTARDTPLLLCYVEGRCHDPSGIPAPTPLGRGPDASDLNDVRDSRRVGAERHRVAVYLEKEGFLARNVSLNHLGCKRAGRIRIRKPGTLQFIVEAPLPEQRKILALRPAAGGGA